MPNPKPKPEHRPWTEEEHEKLVLAVNQLGRSDWAGVSKLVGTRTNKQCRHRYLSYFSHQTGKPANRRPWTRCDLIMIIRLQKTYGNKWSLISTYLPGRTAGQIKNLWHNGNNPEFCRIKDEEAEE